MRWTLVLLLFFAIPSWGQTTSTGRADTTGPCSPAVTGNNNQFNITCKGLSKEQGQRMLDILNKILANELDTQAVMAKLDEILGAVNPNQPTRTYFCNGQWKTTGPSATAAFEISMGGDDTAFRKMVSLNNIKQYPDLLKECLNQISSAPEWLTSRLSDERLETGRRSLSRLHRRSRITLSPLQSESGFS
jgi:hypothetical protein